MRLYAAAGFFIISIKSFHEVIKLNQERSIGDCFQFLFFITQIYIKITRNLVRFGQIWLGICKIFSEKKCKPIESMKR